MRWTPGDTSSDIEDRRDEGGGGGGGGGFSPMGFGGMHLGIGGMLVLLVLSFVFKRDLLSPFLGGGSPAASVARAPDRARDSREQPLVKFVSFVLDDTQHNWEKVLPEQAGVQYRHAKLVLFRDLSESACGRAESATGPFYCPGDEKVYIDLGFYDELKSRFGAPGEFAQAYVLAHEIGHHIQKLVGTERKVRAAQQRNPGAVNALSVRLELQADCYAGIWGNSTEQRGLLDPKDVEQGLAAAAAVGDDRIQRMAGRQVSPERFTHGSSSQRMKWFQEGFHSGNMSSCDTFAQE